MELKHTCIKDDGGAPNRVCYACKAEPTIEELASKMARCITECCSGESLVKKIAEAMLTFPSTKSVELLASWQEYYGTTYNSSR